MVFKTVITMLKVKSAQIRSFLSLSGLQKLFSSNYAVLIIKEFQQQYLLFKTKIFMYIIFCII